MAQSEKGTLLPAPRATAPKPRWRSAAAFLLHAILLALVFKTSFGIYHRYTAGEDPFSSREKCPQTEPLMPSQQSDALSEMEHYLSSDKFRNDTVEHVAGAVRIPTPSFDDIGPIGEDPRWETMYTLADYLKSTFPLVHSTLALEKVNTHGLLYTWQGTNASLLPTVFMAHQDVVPVAEATIGQWTHPPFSGLFDGKYIWGRGASDCKNSLVGILEAVELLINAGFVPKRTIVLSFGFDEEISGRRGAGQLAEVLIGRYGKDGAAVIIDEGSGFAGSWGSTFALPGVAEKGYIDVEIIVRMPGGHSSIPPAHSGIGVASELVTLIEANPYKSHFHPENPFLGLLECGNAYSPEFPSSLKKHMPWKEPSCPAKKDKLALVAAEEGDAVKYLFTTSIAVDVISGGVKNNALPERTRVIVNHRVNIGDQVSDVKAKLTHLAHKVASKHNLTVQAFTDDPEIPTSIKLSSGHNLEPAPVTPTITEGVTPYGILSGTTRALYGKTMLIAPALMTGNTDTRYYWDLTKHIFRFNPGFDPENGFGLGGIHTVDEKLSVNAHIALVKWYSMFVRNMDEANLS
ncbi:peptidase family M20/M25/M40 [Astrocystis sublimbata]|nr:peptidase family M20/M25/M40 [Astrocystis sublimbata]